MSTVITAMAPRTGLPKICPGFPHGMLTTHAEVINKDVLHFIKGRVHCVRHTAHLVQEIARWPRKPREVRRIATS